jgi:hypothetical protein
MNYWKRKKYATDFNLQLNADSTLFEFVCKYEKIFKIVSANTYRLSFYSFKEHISGLRNEKLFLIIPFLA